MHNGFACSSWLVILGLAIAYVKTEGELGTLPTWVKVAGALAAVVVLAVGWALDGRGSGFARNIPPPPPPDDGPDDGPGAPPSEGDGA
jgi:hypothetical protein